MDDDKDGGPAFPESVSADSLGGLNFSRWPGMTLRDYFAAQAIAGLASNEGFIAFTRGFFVALGANEPKGFVTQKGMNTLADAAYQIADAMLKEREK